MKKLLALFLSLSLALLFAACAPKEENAEEISIIFATDMHYFSPALTDGGEFFKSSVAKGDGKVIEYSSQINDAFFAEVIAKKPNLLVLGGDLTLNGSVQSHEEFAQKLEKVRAAGINVLVIPGNHDVDNENTLRFVGDKVEPVEALSSADFVKLYENFGPAQAQSRDEGSFSYIYKASDKLRILMLDANCYGRGYIKDSTLSWIKTVLEEAKNDGANVISVTHQNLFAHSPLLSFGYQLYNADALKTIFEEYNVKLNLSGHIHIQSIVLESGITEIATSSLEMAPIQYGVLTARDGEADYTVEKTDVSGWAKEKGITDTAFADFEKSATEYFEYTSRLKILDSNINELLTSEEAELLAQTFAKANTYYFAGEKFDVSELSEGVKLLEKYEELSFYKSYISSILDTAEKENKNITVKLR